MKVKKITILMASFAVAAVLAACSGGTSSSAATPSSVQVVDCSTVTPTQTVLATAAFTFSPASVSVPVNGVAKWTNTSQVDHTVTSGAGGTRDGVFDQVITPNTSVCLKFTAAGTFNYFCTYHYVSNNMVGIVTVQ